MTITNQGAAARPAGPTAIAIVGFRNAGEIQQCLTHLRKSADRNFVVLICENGGRSSFDALVAALAAELPREPAPASADPVVTDVWRGRLREGQAVEVLCAHDNLGYSGGVNAAIARLGTQFPDWSAVWVLNADTEPDRNALAALVAKARAEPAYGIVGSRLVLSATGRVQAYGGRWRKYTARCTNIGMHRAADAPVDVDTVERDMTYVLGAAMYVTRAYVEDVGVMTDDYFLYAEEVDWCLRRGRFRLGIAPDSIILHHHGGTAGSSSARRNKSKLSVYLDERNKHIIARRFFPALYPIAAVTTLALTAQYLRARSVGNFAAALRGWWAGIRGETGRPVGV